MKQNTLLWTLVATNCVAILLALGAFAEARTSERATASMISQLSTKLEEEGRRQRTALSALVSDSSSNSIVLRGVDGQAETLVRTTYETQNILKAALEDSGTSALGRFGQPAASIPQRLDALQALAQRSADSTERLEGAMRGLELQTTLMESSLSQIRMAIR